MSARQDDIEIRLASPMVTYKENATIDAPALVTALREGARVIEEAIEDAKTARLLNDGEAHKRSDILVRTLTALRYDYICAVDNALDAS